MRLKAQLLASIALAVTHIIPASAQDKTLYVAGSGGSMEKAIRTEVFPPSRRSMGLSSNTSQAIRPML